MEFIDTHAHLYDEAFNGEEDSAVTRAIEAGVHKMILPDIDSETREDMFALASRHTGILFPCLGLHPTSVGADWENRLAELERKLRISVMGIMRCYDINALYSLGCNSTFRCIISNAAVLFCECLSFFVIPCIDRSYLMSSAFIKL